MVRRLGAFWRHQDLKRTANDHTGLCERQRCAARDARDCIAERTYGRLVTQPGVPPARDGGGWQDPFRSLQNRKRVIREDLPSGP